MGLILAPSFDEHTREQIENHIAQVQARRMVAAVEYHAGQHAKLKASGNKIAVKIVRQYELLGKELAQLDKLDEKVRERLETLTNLKNELGLTMDMVELHAGVTNDDE